MIDTERLWTAVLEQAVIDPMHADGCPPHERRRIQYFVRLWFRSTNHDPASFLWICESLDLDVAWFRRRLFAIIDASPVSNPPIFWHPPIRKKKSSMPTIRILDDCPPLGRESGLTISP